MNKVHLPSASKVRVLLFASALFVPMTGMADTVSTVDNTFINTFGNPNTATYGQTFAVPVGDGELTSWTFSLDSTAAFPVQFYVAAWNNVTDEVTGSLLYQSSIIDTTVGEKSYTFTPDLAVTAGSEYVAFLSVSNTPGTGTASMDGSTISYAGGNFVFLNNGTDASQWTSTPWTTYPAYPIPETAFTAQFGPSVAAATPEPGSLALLGTGALGLFGVARRRFAR